MADIHWTVEVCSSKAQSVTLQAGPKSDDNDVFATWRPADGKKPFNLPTRVQSLDNIYFKATTPGRDQTDLCVQYDGRTVRHMSFDGGNEDHDLHANDSDKCPC